jgi:hypothetical protein
MTGYISVCGVEIHDFDSINKAVERILTTNAKAEERAAWLSTLAVDIAHRLPTEDMLKTRESTRRFVLSSDLDPNDLVFRRTEAFLEVMDQAYAIRMKGS